MPASTCHNVNEFRLDCNWKTVTHRRTSREDPVDLNACLHQKAADEPMQDGAGRGQHSGLDVVYYAQTEENL
jgi:hypothetical protein